MEKDHKVYGSKLRSATSSTLEWSRDAATYPAEADMLPLVVDRHQRCQDHRTAQRHSPELPCLLSLAGPGIETHHDGDDVHRRPDVEVLQDEIPVRVPWRHPEQIQVTSDEDQDVQRLGDQRYA